MPSEARKDLSGIRRISSVCASGEKEIDLALVSDIKDIEDSIQYFTALNNSANLIITRNPKDFATSEMPIMGAEEYIKSNH